MLVGTEKTGWVQTPDDGVQRTVVIQHPLVLQIHLRLAVSTVDAGHVVQIHRQQFVLLGYQQRLLVLLRRPFPAWPQLHHLLQIGYHVGLAPFLELLQRPRQLRGLDGLQQVVDAVHGKRVQRILVVGRREHNRRLHVHLVKQREGRTVAQVNIHEHQVGSRVCTQPSHRLLHALQHMQHLYRGVYLLEHRHQVLARRRLVFYNQYFHRLNSMAVQL